MELDELVGKAAVQGLGWGCPKRSVESVGGQVREGPAHPFALRMGPKSLEYAYEPQAFSAFKW